MWPLIARKYPGFSGAKHLIDVGGGDGGFLSSVLRANREALGTVVGLPQCEAAALVIFADAGLADRATFIKGSFFAPLPQSGDLYMLNTILMDWDDQACRSILGRIRDVIDPEGKALVVASLAGPGPERALEDLDMLVFSPSGRLRTPEQLEVLMASAGLRTTMTWPAPMGGLTLIEACVAA